jgi:hypothetical protein
VQLPGRWRHGLVHDNRVGRRVVEQQQNVGEQAMSATQVDDPAAPEEPPHPPRHLPRFIEFLARQAACVTDGSRQAVEERRAGKSIEVAVCQASARGW